jgi:hypothetical protein
MAPLNLRFKVEGMFKGPESWALLAEIFRALHQAVPIPLLPAIDKLREWCVILKQLTIVTELFQWHGYKNT